MPPVNQQGKEVQPTPQSGEFRGSFESPQPEIVKPQVETQEQHAAKLEQITAQIQATAKEAEAPKVPEIDLPDFKGIDNAKNKEMIDAEAVLAFDALTNATQNRPHEQLRGYQHMRHEYLKNRFEFPVPDVEEAA